MQQKALLKLMGFTYTVVYKKGKENTAADSLSRVPESATLHSMTFGTPQWLETVGEGYLQDPQAKELLSELSLTGSNDKGFQLVQGIIKHHDRVWLGGNKEAHQVIMLSLHASGVGGHSGF